MLLRILSLVLFIFSTVTSVALAESYPMEVRAAFIEECASGGGSQALCECVLVEMERQISLEALAHQTFSDDDLLSWTWACAEKHGLGEGSTSSSAPSAEWGVMCQAYFQELETWCSAKTLPQEAESICEDWQKAALDLKNSVPASATTEQRAAFETSCQERQATLETTRMAMRSKP